MKRCEASGCSDTPQSSRNNIPDLLRAMPFSLHIIIALVGESLMSFINLPRVQ